MSVRTAALLPALRERLRPAPTRTSATRVTGELDIAPALAPAQRCLTSVLPDLPAFRFRRFGDGAAVAEELATAGIDDVVTPREDYRYPPAWRRRFERPHPAQHEFFEALFATRP